MCLQVKNDIYDSNNLTKTIRKYVKKIILTTRRIFNESSKKKMEHWKSTMNKKLLMHVIKTRAMVELKEKDYTVILNDVWKTIEENYDDESDIEIYDMHNIVEAVLEDNYPVIAKSIRNTEIIKKTSFI